MLVKQFNYISKEESLQMLESIKYIKHRVIVLLMLDAGLRISEACSIKCKNFDFKNRTLTIQSAKKRGAKHLRTIPISNRLYQAIADYLANAKISIESDSYLFPSPSLAGKHLSRKTMWEAINLISKKNKYSKFASARLTAFVCNSSFICWHFACRNQRNVRTHEL
ncbi:tyrosine-type recombinase/integrase [Flavobacterium muglaense]|uniref:tyrosine-type recombinase/integrase n=1 Tax=Flavobacterium muglaense TaxID=2764716 RepID=UPI0021D0D590|nr:site-specific integrase [Flavobacterium muglaense]